MNLIHRQKILLEDRLRFSPIIRSSLFSYRFRGLSKADISSGEGTAQRVRDLCALARLAEEPSQVEVVESLLEQIESTGLDPADLLDGDSEHKIQKAIILKPYNPETHERGIIFISFEEQWARLLHAKDLKEFARRYDLVVSPTWTPPHSLVNWGFPRLYPGKITCLISNQTDFETFPRLSQNYRMVNLYASSWVDPELFDPKPSTERDIDILMLANFGIYKRHHVLFKALRNLPSDLRVVLVGQPNGDRTGEVLLREAEIFGVRDRIELRQRVTDEEVVDLLCRSKVSLINSKREGSCVAVVESMFANTPVGLIEGAQIGSAAFINPKTGIFLREKHYADDLKDFLNRSESFDARDWCIKNKLSARDSSEILNENLRQQSESRKLPWTKDIIPFHWRPNPTPFNAAGDVWQQAEKSHIYGMFGLDIGP